MFGEGLIHRNVAGLPGVVDVGVDVGVVGRVPHVMLEEPQKGVAEHVVKLVVDPALGDHVAKVYLVPGHGRLDAGGGAIAGHRAVAFPHGAGDPGEIGQLSQAIERGYHAAASPSAFGDSIGGQQVLDRPPVAGQNEAPLAEHLIA